MKKVLFSLMMLMMVSSMASADVVVCDNNLSYITRVSDDATTTHWTSTVGARSTVNMTTNADNSILFTAKSGTDQMLVTCDATNGSWLGDRFNSGIPTIDSEWGPDYNGDGKIDLYVSSRDSFYVVDVTQTGTSVAYNTLATWAVADVDGSDGTGGHLYFDSGLMYSTKGGNSSGNRISVWDPMTGAKISTYNADVCRGIGDITFGADENGDGVRDIYTADHYRNSIKIFDGTDGTYLGAPTGAVVRAPLDIVEAADGTMYWTTRYGTSLSAGGAGSAYANLIHYDPATDTSTLLMDLPGGYLSAVEYIVPEPATYEAENAVYFGVDNTERATASGGRCLRGFDAAGDYVDYQNVVAGNRLIVRYSNQLSNDSRCSLYLDGIDIGHVYFPSTGSWTVFSTVVINIDISANTDIKLQIDADDFAYNNSQSCATQDKIDVISVTGLLDEIIFGNGISESFLHTTSFADTTSGTGALSESYRKCNNTDSSTSSMTFEMVCQPDVQNYLTLKFWGSDTLSSRQYLYLYDGSTKIGSYGSDEPEIINWNDEPALPGCFVYVTYMIPTSMTGSNSSVTLKVAGSKLPIYKGYTHIDPFFDPAGEAQGSPSAFSGSRPAPGGETAVEHIQDQLELAIDRFLTWQLYGTEWDQWVADGKGPEMMTGSINIHGVKTEYATKDEYKLTWASRQEAHVRAQMAVEVIALAYHAPWSQYYQDPEIIDRVVKALDFYRVAQGSDGGFVELENESGRWCGGPNRSDGSGSLMGFGFKGPAAAFLAVYDEILAAGYLDPTETVDEDDNDATAEVTRKQAYINYFKGVRDNLTTSSNRGHASNQDIVGLFAAYLYDECLALLDPAQTWNSTEKQYYFDVCIGEEDGIYGGPWVSDKGTSMEGNGIARGGYCGGYGEHNHEHWMRLAHLSGNTEVRDYGLLAHEMMAMMRYTGYDASLYPVLRREGWNSWRHTYVPGAEEPGNGIAMGAVLYNDPVCLRQVQLAEQYGQYYLLDLSSYWVHFPSNASYWMRQVDYIEQALALPDTDYRLPFEAGEPDFAWADEEAKLIVVKQGDIRFNATMNWRHGLLNDVRHPDNSLANNKAKVHYTDGEKDRMLTAGMRTPFGMHELYIFDFGDYTVGMNASADTSHEFTLPVGHPDSAIDLISGQVVDLTTNPTLTPRSTMIFDFHQAEYCGDRNTQYLTNDFDIDCDVDLNDFADFAYQWLNAYTIPDFAVMGSDWSPSGYAY